MTVNSVENKELRHFGIITGTILAILFGAVLPWLFDHAFSLWPWIVGSVLILWALIHPTSLRWVYHGWMTLGHVLGWINTRIILGFVFYLIVLPTGIITRLFSRDPMKRRFNRDSETYRILSSKLIKNHFERPF